MTVPAGLLNLDRMHWPFLF